MTTEKNHARDNAKAHIEDIDAAFTAIEDLEGGADSVEYAGETFTDADEIRERIQEQALSVLVRSTWHEPGKIGSDEDGEFEILLTTGGPGLRVYGELSGGEPESFELQYQDWGTPWTRYELDENHTEAMGRFVSLFYFGG